MCRLLTYRTIWLIHLKNNSNENRKRWNFIKNWTFDVLEVFLAFSRIIQAFPYFIWTNFYIVFICGMIQLCVYSLPYKPFACTIKLLKKSFREIYWSVNKHIGKSCPTEKSKTEKLKKSCCRTTTILNMRFLIPPDCYNYIIYWSNGIK